MAYLQKLFVNPFTRKSIKHIFKQSSTSSIPFFWWEGEKPFIAAIYPLDRIAMEVDNISQPFKVNKDFYSDLMQPIKAIGNLLQAAAFFIYILFRILVMLGRIPALLFSPDQPALFEQDLRDIAYYGVATLCTLLLSTFRLMLTPVKWFIYIPVRTLLMARHEGESFEQDEKIFMHVKQSFQLSKMLSKNNIPDLMRHLYALQTKVEKAQRQERLMMDDLIAPKKLLFTLKLETEFKLVSQNLWDIQCLLEIHSGSDKEKEWYLSAEKKVNHYLNNYLKFFPAEKLQQLEHSVADRSLNSNR